ILSPGRWIRLSQRTSIIFSSHRSKKDMVRHSQQITTADTALDDDMRSRIIKYSITMGIRTVCFVAAYFAFRADLHVIMWICVAVAVVLPYPAVIFANAGREVSRDDQSALLDQAPAAQLPPSRGETVSGDTISGEAVDDPDEAADRSATGAAEEDTGSDGAAPGGEADEGPPDVGHGETILGETVSEGDSERDLADDTEADETQERFREEDG